MLFFFLFPDIVSCDIITLGKKGEFLLSPAMLKMWVSFAGMAFMFLAIILILFSRHKLKGTVRIITAIVAYAFMILSGIIMFVTIFA